MGLVDLHTHTNVSDGDYSPEELLRVAEQRGVSTIVIADHDSVDGYTPELFVLAKRLGICLIPGIEMSSVDDLSQQKVHVLGININPYHKNLRNLCAELRHSREIMAEQFARKLHDHGLELNIGELIESGEIITKAHIARGVLSNSMNMKTLIANHGKLPLQGEFIEKWLNLGCPAYVPKTQPLSTKRAIEAIHLAGGVASCAHPSFNVMKGFSFNDMKKLILRNGFDAVEAINVQYDKENSDQRFDMIQEFSEFANKSNLIITGGSDYHSDNKELWGNMTELGMADESLRISQTTVDKILSAKCRKVKK